MGSWSLKQPPAGGPGAPAAMPTPPTGIAPDPTTKTCPRCNASISVETRFCTECGYSFGTPSQGTPALSGGPGSGPSAAALHAASFAPTMAAPLVSPPGVSGASANPARLVTILKDGSDGSAFMLSQKQCDIGRTEGDLVFADDPYLSARHARLIAKGDRWVLRDLGSVNGVFVRLREDVELVDGDVVLIGQQVLRFEVLEEPELSLGPAMQHGVMVFGTPEAPRFGRLVQYTTEGVGRDVFYLYRDETILGRENGDIVFTDDPFLSRKHASIAMDRATKRFTLRDHGSSNGTALRVRGETELRHGMHFRVGRHLFRFDTLT